MQQMFQPPKCNLPFIVIGVAITNPEKYTPNASVSDNCNKIKCTFSFIQMSEFDLETEHF